MVAGSEQLNLFSSPEPDSQPVLRLVKYGHAQQYQTGDQQFAAQLEAGHSDRL